MTEKNERCLDKLDCMVVCLSGSTRFIDIMAAKAFEMERDGDVITLGCHLLPAWYGAEDHHQAEAEGCADHMDAIHLSKIDMADELLVFNIGGYIGDSTRREIEYATAKGMPVNYFEPITHNDCDETRGEKLN
jgi:hypothetical protein